jgi:hypothetical protein
MLEVGPVVFVTVMEPEAVVFVVAVSVSGALEVDV